jgi:hypothetical protein
MSCLHAMNNNLNMSRTTFIEAKLKKELPPLEVIAANINLDLVTR